jgi:protein SCO1/2
VTRPAATALVLAAVLAGVLGATGCGGDSNAAVTAAAPVSKYDGAPVQPRRPAPPLRLRDSDGRLVDLRNFRGRAVVVTFLYTHCPDVCPLIAGHLRTVQARLGRGARDLEIIAVSTDPRRDTPKAVHDFLAAHRMLGRMRYLVGTPAQLRPVWRAWHVIAEPDAKDPNFIDHTSYLYGIDARGRLTTLYPASFQPAEIAHDVPLLSR